MYLCNKYYLVYSENEVKVNFSTKKIFLSVILPLALACKSAPEPPQGSVDIETMSNIIADIHLTEAKMSRLSFQDFDSTKVAFKYYELKVFAKYKIDTAQYRKSYDFYAANPEYMTTIYDKAIKILEKKKEKKSLD